MHTLDLVVLAAEWGHGRRPRLALQPPPRRARPDGGWAMLGKTFKGLTDELLAWQTERLLGSSRPTARTRRHVRPELVVEIALRRRPALAPLPAGMALRFARVKRYRQDKPAAEADTVETVRALGGLA